MYVLMHVLCFTIAFKIRFNYAIFVPTSNIFKPTSYRCNIRVIHLILILENIFLLFVEYFNCSVLPMSLGVFLSLTKHCAYSNLQIVALNLICLPDLCNILECKLTILSRDGVNVNLCQLLKASQYSVI